MYLELAHSWVCSGILLISSAFQEQEKTQIPFPFNKCHFGEWCNIVRLAELSVGPKEDKVEWSSELSLASNSVSLFCSFRKIHEMMLKGGKALYLFLLDSRENASIVVVDGPGNPETYSSSWGLNNVALLATYFCSWSLGRVVLLTKQLFFFLGLM